MTLDKTVPLYRRQHIFLLLVEPYVEAIGRVSTPDDLRVVVWARNTFSYSGATTVNQILTEGITRV